MREWAFRLTNNYYLMKIQFFPPVTYHSHLGEILDLLKPIGALPLTFSVPGAASLFCQTCSF